MSLESSVRRIQPASPAVPSTRPGSLFQLPVPIVPTSGVSLPVGQPFPLVPSSSSPFCSGNAGKQTWKLQEDCWVSNPPQVKSYLAYSTASKFGPISESDTFTAVSLNCGFGWRFRFKETFHYLKSNSNPRIQDLVGRVSLTLEPNLCSSMPLSKVKIILKVTFPSDSAKATEESRYTDVSLQSETQIGTITKPVGYQGQLHFEVTLLFSESDGLSLPTTSSPSTRKALQYSLDGPSFVDTKFYLFSSKIRGRPARPKAVFANSMLLKDGSTYLRDLLSASGFANGTPCDLYEDAAKEIAKLDVDAYDYDSDSDLEDECEDDEVKGHSMETLPSEMKNDTASDVPSEEPTGDGPQVGRAFAINGTAHKTWKAFIYYCYTNNIHFNGLQSRSNLLTFEKLVPENPDIIRCSPKSMYRFADYANLPELMSLAKEAIQKNLSQSNIVAELFSNFTSRYPEIIDLEIRYLVDNFTSRVANDFDEMLGKIVDGSMPHCGQVLKLIIKELRAAGSKGPKVPTNSFWGGKPRSSTSQTPASTVQKTVLPGINPSQNT